MNISSKPSTWKQRGDSWSKQARPAQGSVRDPELMNTVELD